MASFQGTVILTGASGFIGRHLKKRLIEDEVDVLTIRRPSSPPSNEGRSVELSYEDVEGLSDLFAKEQPHYVFHLAGATKGVSYDDFHRANVLPTQNLLQALRESHAPLKRFVMVSSLAAYGPAQKGGVVVEDSERRPVEFYGQSKLEAELCVEATDLPYTIIRPGGVYGPGDVDYFEAFKYVAKGWNLFFGNRDRTMSVVYIDDVVDAIISAASHERTKQNGYFIADGKPVSWDQFQGTLMDAAGKDARTLNVPEFFVTAAAVAGELLTKIDKKPRLMNRQKAIMGRQEAWTCSIAKASQDFGFEPRISLREGARRSFDWYRSAGWI